MNRAVRFSVEPQIDSGTSDIRPSLCTRSVGKRTAKSCLGLSPSMVADVLLWGESSRGLRVAKSSRLGRVFQAGCLLPPWINTRIARATSLSLSFVFLLALFTPPSPVPCVAVSVSHDAILPFHTAVRLSPSQPFPSSLVLTHLHVFFSRFLLTVVRRLSTLFRYRSLPSFLAHRSVSLLGRLFSSFAYRLSSSLYIFYLDRVVTVSVSSTLSLSVYERVRSTFFLLVRRKRTRNKER